MDESKSVIDLYLVGDTPDHAVRTGLLHDDYHSADNFLREELGGEGHIYSVTATVDWNTIQEEK